MKSGLESKQKTLVSLHAVRGIAALGVVLYHLTNEVDNRFHYRILGGLFQTGYCGVDVFFVLSGFILYYVYQKKGLSAGVKGKYLLKRLLRIYPIYWLISGVVLLVLYIAHAHMLEAFHFNWLFIVNTALLLPHTTRFIPPTWTLTYELYFYLLFLVYLTVKNKKAVMIIYLVYSILILLITISGAWHLPWLRVGHSAESVPQIFFSVYVLDFLMGMAAAQLLSNEKVKHYGKYILLSGVVMLSISLISNSLYRISGTPAEEFRFLYFGLPVVLIIYGLASIEYIKRITIPSVLIVLGDVSLALYLSHYPVIQVLVNKAQVFAAPQSGLIILSISTCILVAVLTVGYGLHVLLEVGIINPISRRIYRTNRQS